MPVLGKGTNDREKTWKKLGEVLSNPAGDSTKFNPNCNKYIFCGRLITNN